MSDEIEYLFNCPKGSDYTVYVEWRDKDGNLVVTDASSVAHMDVRDDAGVLVLAFDSGADTTSAAAATVLGTSGIIRLSVPRSVTSALEVGYYPCDLVVDVADSDQTVFATAQRQRTLPNAVFRVTDTTTKP